MCRKRKHCAVILKLRKLFCPSTQPAVSKYLGAEAIGVFPFVNEVKAFYT